MGSPYFVHSQSSAVHVVRSEIGFLRVVDVVISSMGMQDENVRFLSDIEELMLSSFYHAERVVLKDLLDAYREAVRLRERRVLFLEARYEWADWEKFQRVIVLDFSERKPLTLPSK